MCVYCIIGCIISACQSELCIISRPLVGVTPSHYLSHARVSPIAIYLPKATVFASLFHLVGHTTITVFLWHGPLLLHACMLLLQSSKHMLVRDTQHPVTPVLQPLRYLRVIWSSILNPNLRPAPSTTSSLCGIWGNLGALLVGVAAAAAQWCLLRA